MFGNNLFVYPDNLKGKCISFLFQEALLQDKMPFLLKLLVERHFSFFIFHLRKLRPVSPIGMIRQGYTSAIVGN
jgi:hypothetical protein